MLNTPSHKIFEKSASMRFRVSLALTISAISFLAFSPGVFALSDEERKEDIAVPNKPKPRFVAVYGDKYLRAIEAQILELAKKNNVDWSEKQEDVHVQQLKEIFEKEDSPHALATLAIWCWLNREDDPLVRRLFHYDHLIEAAFYQAMFRISDVGGADAEPALMRIMHQVDMNKDAMDKLVECLNAVTNGEYKAEKRVKVSFSDERLNELPAPEDVAQFIIPLKETLWRLWKSPTFIPTELHAKAKFTIDEHLVVSNISVGVVTKTAPKSAWAMKGEYADNALQSLKRLKVTHKMPIFTKQTDVFVEFYGP